MCSLPRRAAASPSPSPQANADAGRLSAAGQRPTEQTESLAVLVAPTKATTLSLPIIRLRTPSSILADKPGTYARVRARKQSWVGYRRRWVGIGIMPFILHRGVVRRQKGTPHNKFALGQLNRFVLHFGQFSSESADEEYNSIDACSNSSTSESA